MGQQTSRQLNAVGTSVGSLARSSVSSFTSSKRERHSKWLDNKLAELLRARAQNRGGTIKTFNQVLLKFGQLNEGFQGCHRIFNNVDKRGKGQLCIQDVQEGAAATDTGLDSEIISKLFDSADLEGTQQLDFREFVLVISAVYIFRDARGLTHHLDPAIINMFEIILDAFLYFDASGEGFIRKSDVMAALGETGSPTAKQARTKPKQTALTSTIGKRFEELDWDHSGHISFKEFLYGIEGWVMEEYAEEPVDQF